MMPMRVPWYDLRLASIGRAVLPPLVIALPAIVLFLFPPARFSFYPQCPINEYLHLQCPGCGGTRALAALLHGQLAEAFHFNALITLLLPFAAAYGILCYRRLVEPKPFNWPQASPLAMHTALAVTAAFTVVRNLPLHSF
jgi:hypothetical protein